MFDYTWRRHGDTDAKRLFPKNRCHGQCSIIPGVVMEILTLKGFFQKTDAMANVFPKNRCHAVPANVQLHLYRRRYCRVKARALLSRESVLAGAWPKSLFGGNVGNEQWTKLGDVADMKLRPWVKCRTRNVVCKLTNVRFQMGLVKSICQQQLRVSAF